MPTAYDEIQAIQASAKQEIETSSNSHIQTMADGLTSSFQKFKEKLNGLSLDKRAYAGEHGLLDTPIASIAINDGHTAEEIQRLPAYIALDEVCKKENLCIRICTLFNTHAPHLPIPGGWTSRHSHLPGVCVLPKDYGQSGVQTASTPQEQEAGIYPYQRRGYRISSGATD